MDNDLIHDTDTCDIEHCPACQAIYRDLEADRRLDDLKHKELDHAH